MSIYWFSTTIQKGIVQQLLKMLSLGEGYKRLLALFSQLPVNLQLFQNKKPYPVVYVQVSYMRYKQEYIMKELSETFLSPLPQNNHFLTL